MMTTDLEFLREIFKDTRLHIGIGTITQLGLANDGSILRVQVNLLPEDRQIIAQMGFEDVYQVTFPEIDDLCVVAFVDGQPDDAFVIKVYNSTDEKIPVFAQTGHSTLYSRPGKKMYLGSDTKVGIGRPNVEPTEPLVLGNVTVEGLTALCNAFLQPGGTPGNPIGQCLVGPVFLDPAVRTAINTFVSTYLTTPSTNILSQISFTERGV